MEHTTYLEPETLSVCTICLLLADNAPSVVDASEIETGLFVLGMGEHLGYAWYADGTDLGYSHAECEVCRAPYGGMRYALVGLPV